MFSFIKEKRRTSFLLFFGLLLPTLLRAEIRETTRIAEVFSEVRPDSILLMDLDETLIESSIMLGGKAWRDYAVNLLKTTYSQQKIQALRDKITYWIAKRVPCSAIESNIHIFLDQLRDKQIPVFGFTARGKKHCNTLPCTDGEELACLHLRQAGYNLEVFPTSFSDVFLSHTSFSKGIFFAKSPFEDKGSLALEIFAQVSPAHVLFVDDRMDNVYSMDRAFAKLNIHAICFYYPHVDLHRSFDPLIAAIQLEQLYLNNLVYSDSEAMLLKQHYALRDPDLLSLEIIEHLCSP
jgi:hypothetical protein